MAKLIVAVGVLIIAVAAFVLVSAIHDRIASPDVLRQEAAYRQQSDAL